MDYERALEKVETFIALCEHSLRMQEQNPTRYFEDPGWRETDRKITEALPQMERIAGAVDERLVDGLRAPDQVITHNQKCEASRKLRGAIVTMEETNEILEDQGPKLRANDLHPWVWATASGLWSDGYRRAAVQAAATALFDSHIPAKLGRLRDTRGGVDLMGQAFSTRPPDPDAPRLRFTAITPGTPEWTSAHEGAMKLGQGAAQAIRNLTTHDLSEPGEQEALEMLAVLSYVARLVAKADVERVP